MPESPVIVAIYGEPGTGKTTLGNTCEKVIVIDADRGVDRSKHRKDTLVVNSWDEVILEEKNGIFDGYKTVVIDTPKALLDDFLMAFVIKQDQRLRSNKLKAYGAIGDEFKLFVNNRRLSGQDLLLICHAKTEEDGDFKLKLPDVTGQSYALIMRIADQVGYLTTVNNKRTIVWDPTDKSKGKNVAQLEAMLVPGVDDPALFTFMPAVIERIRKAKQEASADQLAAVNKSAELQKELDECESPECMTEILGRVNQLPKYLAVPLQALIVEKAKKLGFVANKELKRFERANGTKPPETGTNGAKSDTPVKETGTTGQKNETPPTDQPPAGDGLIFTTVDERSQELGNAGAVLAGEGFNYGKGNKNFMEWGELAKLSEDNYTALLKEVRKFAPKKTAPAGQ